MTARRPRPDRRSRRAFLTDLGRTATGLVVVGGGLTACTSDDPVVEVPGDLPTAGPSEDATSEATQGVTASEEAGGNGTSPLLVDLGFVAAYVAVRDGEAAVLDTGVADSEDAILAVLEANGLGWADVGNVIVTHNHPDHAGSLAAVAAAAEGAGLFAGEADIGGMVATRPITAVGDGDTVFDLQIIETPGHTPGHISIFDPMGRYVMAGDALVGDGGMLAGPNPEFTADLDTAIASVGKLAGLDVDEVLVCHGFPTTGGQAELQALADSL